MPMGLLRAREIIPAARAPNQLNHPRKGSNMHICVPFEMKANIITTRSMSVYDNTANDQIFYLNTDRRVNWTNWKHR
jgi:hypothetical protein